MYNIFTLTLHQDKNQTLYVKLFTVISQEMLIQLVTMTSRKHPVTAPSFRMHMDQGHSHVPEAKYYRCYESVTAKDSVFL